MRDAASGIAFMLILACSLRFSGERSPGTGLRSTHSREVCGTPQSAAKRVSGRGHHDRDRAAIVSRLRREVALVVLADRLHVDDWVLAWRKREFKRIALVDDARCDDLGTGQRGAARRHQVIETIVGLVDDLDDLFFPLIECSVD